MTAPSGLGSWLCGLALALPPAQAQDRVPAGSAVLASLSAIRTDYQDEQQQIIRRYQEATDDRAREKVLADYDSMAPRYIARCLRLVQVHPDNPAIEKVLAWAATLPGQGAEYDRATGTALTVFVRRNPSSQALLGILPPLAQFDSPGRIEPLRVIYARAEPQGLVRTHAGVGLARALRRRYEEQWQAKKGSGLADYQEADKILTELAAGEPAEGQARELLFLLRNLSIGKPAPEIAAEDLDGVPFKLSDYRGKVVVLDFWGNW